MDLSTEDNLRLNVLLASKPEAIRINESSMIVYGLSPRGEAKIQLNPTGRDEIYLRSVRELISGFILGSPDGYPLSLQRWTRMGQARDESLEQLLLLGEPEAIMAVVHAKGLTIELARRAWWAMPEPDNARLMLQNQLIVNSDVGRELATHLAEFLPFEPDPIILAESVSLVLQPDLIDEKTHSSLWRRAQNKNSYLLGFLWGAKNNMPEPLAAHAELAQLQQDLQPLLRKDNPVAKFLIQLFSHEGQTFIHVAEQVLKKPNNQDIVNKWTELLATYFSALRPDIQQEGTLDDLLACAINDCDMTGKNSTVAGLAEVLIVRPDLREAVQSMQVLSGLSYAVLRAIFSRTDSIGSLMRKKLKPVTTILFQHLKLIRLNNI